MAKDKREFEKFGETLEYWRNQKGYSIRELSDITGISSSYINRLERRDRRNPTFPIIKILANGLGLTVEAFTYVEKEDREEEKLLCLSEVLITNNFSLKGKEVSQDKKMALVDITEAMQDFVWSNDVKYKEALKLIHLVDEYKAL